MDFTDTKEIQLKSNELHDDIREEYFNFGLVNQKSQKLFRFCFRYDFSLVNFYPITIQN